MTTERIKTIQPEKPFRPKLTRDERYLNMFVGNDLKTVYSLLNITTNENTRPKGA
jgi:hypothetical protein